jgi:SAM-dependent methyltransferase
MDDDAAGAGTEGSPQRVYSLGHSDQELERLSIQARLIGPITRRYFVEAGIVSGMRVLDVGSGAGDVALLAADLVGEKGEVIGTDRAATALAAARERATARSLRNVTFREGDPAEMTFDQPFDAVVGRYVLMYQQDPAAMLRKLVSNVRPGGVVVFHEPDRDGVLSFPLVPDYDRGCQLVDETFRLTGADPRMGIKLHATFVAAGLPAPTMRLEAVIGGGDNSSEQVHFEMDVVGTLMPEMERLGIATADDIDANTLAARVLAQVTSSGSVVVGRSEVGAWCRA